MLLTCLLPFLATEGSRVLEKKENETQVSKTVFSYLKYQQTYILPAYTIYIYSVLSWQCITGQFQIWLLLAVLWPERDFVAMFWLIFLPTKAKKDQINSCFHFNLLCDRFYDRFHEKHLSQLEWPRVRKNLKFTQWHCPWTCPRWPAMVAQTCQWKFLLLCFFATLANTVLLLVLWIWQSTTKFPKPDNIKHNPKNHISHLSIHEFAHRALWFCS